MNTPKDYTYKENTPEQQEKEQKARILFLNDQLRMTGQGGKVVATPGIASLPKETQLAITQAIQNFSAFTSDNDPYKEHDLALLEVQGIKVMYKIDYFAQDMIHHSPDKADPTVTNRVMTIMLASEY